MRRQAMLDAARAVFAEKGYRTATLDEIAQRAEFGKGTLYNYFEGGKEALLFAVLDDVHSDLHDLTAKVFDLQADVPLRERVHRFVETLFGYFRENEDLFAILMKEANRLCFGDDPEKALYFKEQNERILGLLAPAIAAAIESGELRPLPVDGVAHMILGNVDGYIKYSIFERLGADADGTERRPLPAPDKAAAFITDILFDGMAAPAGALEPAPSAASTSHA